MSIARGKRFVPKLWSLWSHNDNLPSVCKATFQRYEEVYEADYKRFREQRKGVPGSSERETVSEADKSKMRVDDPRLVGKSTRERR